MDRLQPHERDVECGGQRAGDGDDGQPKEQEGIGETGRDLLFGEQLDHVGKGLEPARADAVLEARHQLAVDPLVEHAGQDQRQPGRKDQERNQGGKCVHL